MAGKKDQKQVASAAQTNDADGEDEIQGTGAIAQVDNNDESQELAD